jgi:hypothetical protein
MDLPCFPNETIKGAPDGHAIQFILGSTIEHVPRMDSNNPATSPYPHGLFF